MKNKGNMQTKINEPYSNISQPVAISACCSAVRDQEEESETENAGRRGSLIHFHTNPSIPSSHRCPSPPLNPAAWGGKTNRVYPVAAAPRGLRGAFWKVISAHCSGLKCCHAALVPNCFAATPSIPSPTYQQQTRHIMYMEAFIRDVHPLCLDIFRDV